jgi:hypothetical protein
MGRRSRLRTLGGLLMSSAKERAADFEVAVQDHADGIHLLLDEWRDAPVQMTNKTRTALAGLIYLAEQWQEAYWAWLEEQKHGKR